MEFEVLKQMHSCNTFYSKNHQSSSAVKSFIFIYLFFSECATRVRCEVGPGGTSMSSALADRPHCQLCWKIPVPCFSQSEKQGQASQRWIRWLIEAEILIALARAVFCLLPLRFASLVLSPKTPVMFVSQAGLSGAFLFCVLFEARVLILLLGLPVVDTLTH